MKKFFVLIISLLTLNLIYRFFFEYRIIAFSNEGDLKYKELNITYFPRAPFSIINPFKKAKILDKISVYCNSDKFENYYVFNNYSKIKHRNFFLYKQLAFESNLYIKAIKQEKELLLILVSSINDSEIELVFKLDINTDEIVGYY